MSTRRQQRKEADRAISSLERTDLEQVVRAQQYVVGVTMGQRPFEHPGSPPLAPGSRYMPNQSEVTFSQQSKSTLMSNFFRFVIVGSLTPYITLRVFSVMQKRIIPVQRYVIWSSLGGGFGGMYGLTLGRMAIARDYLTLDNSPLATEARYQLWKLNPVHPFLKGFEHETVDWNEYKYGSGAHRQSFSDEQKYDDYNRNINRDRGNRDRDSYNDEYENNDRMDNDMNINDESMRRKKRDRFYSGRNRINNKSFDDHDDNVEDFFDLDNGRSPHDEVSDFFEGDNKQKWD
eukprot:551091_1